MRKNNVIRSEALAPNAYMQRWQMENLPDPRHYWITDIDMTIRTRAGCVMLVEVKTKGARVGACQFMTYEVMDAALSAIDGESITITTPSGQEVQTTVNYFGWHVLEMEDGTFNGPLKWNGRQVSEQEVKALLSFDYCCDCLPVDAENPFF